MRSGNFARASRCTQRVSHHRRYTFADSRAQFEQHVSSKNNSWDLSYNQSDTLARFRAQIAGEHSRYIPSAFFFPHKRTAVNGIVKRRHAVPCRPYHSSGSCVYHLYTYCMCEEEKISQSTKSAPRIAVSLDVSLDVYVQHALSKEQINLVRLRPEKYKAGY